MPNGFMPQRGGGIAGSLNEARWSYAITGRRDRGFIQRSPMVLCPNGAQGDSPGQSEAPPWDWCARNNPSPERAEPAVRQSMRACSALSGLWRIGASAYPGRSRTTQGGASLYPGLSHYAPLGRRSGYGSVFKKSRGLSPSFLDLGRKVRCPHRAVLPVDRLLADVLATSSNTNSFRPHT